MFAKKQTEQYRRSVKQSNSAKVSKCGSGWKICPSYYISSTVQFSLVKLNFGLSNVWVIFNMGLNFNFIKLHHIIFKYDQFKPLLSWLFSYTLTRKKSFKKIIIPSLRPSSFQLFNPIPPHSPTRPATCILEKLKRQREDKPRAFNFDIEDNPKALNFTRIRSFPLLVKRLRSGWD